MKRSRMILGAALAPAVLPLLYGGVSLLFSAYSFGAPGHLKRFLLDVVAIACVCYAVSYLLGVPVVGALLWARRLTFFPCALLGTLVGAAAAAMAYRHYWESGVEIGFAALLGGSAAFLVAWVFCLLAGVPWRRAAVVTI